MLTVGVARTCTARLPRADLPAALPVTVSNLREHWTVALVDLADCRWRPLGVLESTAYGTLDTAERDWDVFIGHPVIADDEDLVLNLVQTGAAEWTLEIHNPTDRTVAARVSRSPFFNLLNWLGENVRLAPGASAVRKLDAADAG